MGSLKETAAYTAIVERIKYEIKLQFEKHYGLFKQLEQGTIGALQNLKK